MRQYGASGHAKVIIGILKLLKQSISKIYDDKAPFQLLDYKVTSFDNDYTGDYIISVGNNKARKKISKLLNKAHFGNAIHPTSIIDSSVEIAIGTVVMASATINPATVIGKHCIINTSASIDHDCVIADFAHISPNATLCGNVAVGEGTQIGAGAVINPNISIGKWCVVGAGAVIIKNIPDNATVVGNPGRIINL